MILKELRKLAAGLSALLLFGTADCSLIMKTKTVEIPGGHYSTGNTAQKVLILSKVYNQTASIESKYNGCKVTVLDSSIPPEQLIERIAGEADTNNDNWISEEEIRERGSQVCEEYRSGLLNQGDQISL